MPLRACASRMFAAALSVTLYLAATNGFADSTNWSQWRGPERTGLYSAFPGLPATLPASVPVVWRIKAGEGFASPVVSDGTVFLFDNQDGHETLRALSAADGHELWRAVVDECFKDSQGPPGPRCTPVVDGDRVYAQSCRGELHCLSVVDGRKRWGVNFSRDFGAVFIGEKGNAAGAMRHGNNGSPLVSGDLLFASVGSTNGAGMVAFDKRTGAVKWKSGNEVAAYAAPVITRLAKPTQVVNFMAEGLTAFDAATGRQLWKLPLRTDFARHVMTPVLHERERLVIFGSHQTALIAARFTPKDGGYSVEEAWRNKEAAPNFSSGFAFARSYYGLGADRKLVCVDLASGRLNWSQDGWVTTPAERAHAGFVFDASRSLALLDDGQLVLWEPRPGEYRELGRVQVCGVNWCEPAFAGGRLYLRDGLKGPGQLLCLDLGAR